MKKISLTLLFLSGIIAFQKGNSQTTKIFNVSQDIAIGYHDNYNTGVGDKNAIQNAAYSIPGSSGGLNVNRAVLKFNTQSIPVGSIIVSAKLSLYGLGPSGTLPGHTGTENSAYIQRVTSNWDEITCTWNNQPTSTNLNQVVLAASKSFNQDYLNIDVTNLVNDMKNDSSFGFILKLVSENPKNALLFCSSNYSDSTKHPTLEITYCEATTSSLKTLKDVAIGYHDNYNTGIGDKNAIQNAAYCIPGSSGGLNVNRALIDFDLSAYTNSDEILEAKLNLYGLGPSGTLPGHTGTNNSAYLQRIVKSWQESSATYSNQPASTKSNEVLLSASTTYNQDYLNIDVTQLVKDMVSKPDSSFGFMLKLVSEQTKNALLFCSSNYSNASKHPTLVIKVKNCEKATVIVGCKDPLSYNYNRKANVENPDSCSYVDIEYNDSNDTINAVDTLGTEVVNTCGKIDIEGAIQSAKILSYYLYANEIAVKWGITQGGNLFTFDVYYDNYNLYGWMLFTFSINCYDINGIGNKLAGTSTNNRTFGDAILLSPTGIEEIKIENNTFKATAYPNPINENNLNISFDLEDDQPVNLEIYNSIGGLVISKSINGKKGVNTTSFAFNNLSSGMYTCKVIAGKNSDIVKIIK